MILDSEQRGQLAIQYVAETVAMVNTITDTLRLKLEYIQADADEAALRAEDSQLVYQLRTAKAAALEATKKSRAQRTVAHKLVQIAQEEVARHSEEIRDVVMAAVDADDNFTLHAIEDQIEQSNNALSLYHDVNEDVIRQYEERQARLLQLQQETETMSSHLTAITEEIERVKGPWAAELKELVSEISREFGKAFASIGCAGEVQIGEHVDFDQWSLKVFVKFREEEKLQILDSKRQSGGERSVSTIFYLMSLQGLAKAPFRVVDEINQGMDPRNERMMHSRMIHTACEANTSQYEYR